MNKAVKLFDNEALCEALEAHRKLIERALATNHRQRFQTVQKIAALSEALLASASGEDVTTFDSRSDLMKTAIEVLGPIVEGQRHLFESGRRRAIADELASMLELRKAMVGMGEGELAEIDSRIGFLRKEITTTTK